MGLWLNSCGSVIRPLYWRVGAVGRWGGGTMGGCVAGDELLSLKPYDDREAPAHVIISSHTGGVIDGLF